MKAIDRMLSLDADLLESGMLCVSAIGGGRFR